MKKMSFTLLSMLLLVGSSIGFAEDLKEDVPKEEVTESIVTKETSGDQEETLTSSTKEDVGVASPDVKESIAREITFLNIYLQRGYLTEEEYNMYAEKINNSKTTEELSAIVDELFANYTEILSYRWAFGERYINLKINIQDYQKQGKVTKEQAEKMLQELELAKTVEDIEKVSSDLRKIIGDGEDTATVAKEKKDNAKRYLEILIANNYITEEQFKQLSAELDAVTTDTELEAFFNNVAALSTEPEMFMWAFSESYINIRANISTSLKDGNITEEQANKLFTQVDAARTRAQLDAVSQELNALLKGTGESTTTTTTTKETTSENKKTNEQGALPKTGENKTKVLNVVLGSFIIASTGVAYILFRRKKIR